MNLTTPLKVMIVEDHIAIRQQVEDFLQQLPGFVVTGACGTVHEALILMRATKPDLFILDTELPDGTGFDILEQLPENSRVLFLVNPWEHDARRALGFGAIEYVLKSSDGQELINAFGRAN